jgi:hypothetical protein
MIDLSGAILTEHAKEQLLARGIDESMVREVLRNPADVTAVRPGRVVAQAVVIAHLIRVFVDIDRNPPEVVTVYQRSKLTKYRRQP